MEEEDAPLIKFLNVIIVWVIVFVVYKYTGFRYMNGVLGSLALVILANSVIVFLLYFLQKIFFTKKKENKEND